MSLDMNVRQRMSVEKAAKAYWAKLDTTQRWALGDALVLGEFDWRDWLASKPSREFLNYLDAERIHWEACNEDD